MWFNGESQERPRGLASSSTPRIVLCNDGIILGVLLLLGSISNRTSGFGSVKVRISGGKWGADGDVDGQGSVTTKDSYVSRTGEGGSVNTYFQATGETSSYGEPVNATSNLVVA